MVNRKAIGWWVFAGVIVQVIAGMWWAQDSFADDGGSWIGSGTPTYSSDSYTGGGGYYGGDVCDSDSNAASYLQCQGYSWIYYKYTGRYNDGETLSTVFRPDSSVNAVSSACSKHDDGGFWHFGYNMRGIFYSDYYSVFGNSKYVKGLDNSVRVTYSTSLGGRGHAETLTNEVINSGYYSWVNNVGDGYSDHYFTHDKSELNHVIYVDGDAVYRAVKYSSNPNTNPNAAVLQDYKRACKASGKSDSECARIPDDAYAFCYWAGLAVGDNMGRVRVLESSDEEVGYDDFTGWKKTTDWVKTEKTINPDALECPASGCDVQFRHYLRNTKNNGSTRYKIVREGVNPATIQQGSKNLVVNENDFVMSDVVNIKPGEKVCETLYWSKDSSTNPGSTPYAKVCVSAKPLEQPDENTISADLKIRVKNRSISSDTGNANAGYREETYIKPRDNVSFRVDYNPAPQAVSNLVPNRMSINGGSTINNTGSASAVDLFNDNNSGRLVWSNAFQVYDGLLDGKNGGKYEVGNRNIQTIEYHLNSVDKKAGQTIITRARTDASDSSATPTKAVVTKQNETIDKLDLYTDQIKPEAAVHIPYNYRNEVRINGPVDGVFYAGESMEVSFVPVVKGKYNSVTEGYYATNVDYPKVKGCVHMEGSSECRVTIEEEIDDDGWNSENNSGSNNSGSDNGLEQGEKFIRVDIPDMAAGGSVCVDISVYPASSGSDDNYDDPEGDHSWNTNSDCFKVAKKPSFQVWGGDIYVGNGVAGGNVPIAKKTDLYTYPLGDGEVRVFGSWGELGVMSGGSPIRNFASGAGMGYVGNNGGVLSPNPFDSISPKIGLNPGGFNPAAADNYCTLTFPTDACGDINNASGVDDPASTGGAYGGSAVNVSSYIDESDFEPDDSAAPDGFVVGGSNVRYYKRKNGEGGLFKGGEIVLNDNIWRVDEDVSFSNLESVPIYFIYGSSINISCDVERIDAILISTTNIDTCANSNPDINPYNSRSHDNLQLVVNGAIIAGGTISFNRTFGAGPGANSIIPGEIINYDPTWYVWNNGTTTSSSSSSENTITSNLMVPVYTRELAPRF